MFEIKIKSETKLYQILEQMGNCKLLKLTGQLKMSKRAKSALKQRKWLKQIGIQTAQVTTDRSGQAALVRQADEHVKYNHSDWI